MPVSHIDRDSGSFVCQEHCTNYAISIPFLVNLDLKFVPVYWIKDGFDTIIYEYDPKCSAQFFIYTLIWPIEHLHLFDVFSKEHLPIEKVVEIDAKKIQILEHYTRRGWWGDHYLDIAQFADDNNIPYLKGEVFAGYEGDDGQPIFFTVIRGDIDLKNMHHQFHREQSFANNDLKGALTWCEKLICNSYTSRNYRLINEHNTSTSWWRRLLDI